MHESGRRDRRDPQARGSRHAHRVPGEPHPRARGAGGHPARHRPPGADRAPHGGRDGEAELGGTDRGVRDAARAGGGERVRRHRAGVRRVGPDPGHADGLRTGHRPRAPQLQLDRRLPPGHQVVRAGVERGRDPERAPPRLYPAPERPARPRRRRGAGRRLRRGGRGAPRLRAGHEHPLGSGPGRRGAGRRPPRRGRAPRHLRGPGSPLREGLAGP